MHEYIDHHRCNTTLSPQLCLLDRKDLCLNNTELLEDAVNLLAPFEAETTEISSEKYVSLSKVIPIVRSLQKLTMASRSKSILRDKLIANTAHRFGTVENNYLLASATFLDPRFKKLGFMQASAANECEKHLLDEMSNITLGTPATSVSDNAENSTFVTATDPVPARSSSSSSDVDVWSFFDAKVIESMTTQTTH
uniref:HAT C-terminal dimerisation domain-containing protein n=1 Tax=Amphimedon queenslandica TaxID=400682 RepID=A0A1X7SJE7_AMPQE